MADDDYTGPTLPLSLPSREDLSRVWQGVQGLLTPPDPYQAAGQAVEQYRAGKPVEAGTTMWGAMPQTGMLKGFYSPAAKAAATLPAKGSPEQLLATLRNRNIPGFGQEEQWSGVGQAFAGRPSVTREELAQHFEKGMPDLQETVLGNPLHHDVEAQRIEPIGENGLKYLNTPTDIEAAKKNNVLFRIGVEGMSDEQILAAAERLRSYGKYGEPKFQQYTLPGGENYREVLMHLPEGEEAYKSSHWDTPNVVAHLRMSDRPLPSGERALHLEELQSDWGQAGRDKGFQSPFSREEGLELQDLNGKEHYVGLTPDEKARQRDLAAKQNAYQVGLPSAPYVTKTQHWTDLGLKRALQEAAQGGYDRLLITPGAEQAARYDLSKQVSKIAYDPKSQSLRAYDRDGYEVLNQAMPKENIASYIGKEAAEKLLATEPGKEYGQHLLQGQDLEIGGRGMKEFYDKLIPGQLSKLLSKIDKNAKIEPYQLPSKPMPSSYQPETRASSTVPDEQWNDMTRAERLALMEQHRQREWAQENAGPTVHSVPISAAMREKILNEGFPAYQAGGAVDPVWGALRLAR